MSEDCYFFVDASVPEHEQKILCLHIECRNEHLPDVGWFYEGSKEGYGPWDYKCHICGGLIHNGENEAQTAN